MNIKRKFKRYPIGAIIGAANSIGQGIGAIAGPIRENAEEVDPYTGEYLNMNKAIGAAKVGATIAPWKVGMDPDAKWGEKIASGLGFGWAVTPGLYRRKQERLKGEAFAARYPDTMGQSVNPYYMAGGGYMPGLQPAELEDGEVFKVPGGMLNEVRGRTHAEGGEMYMLPEGTGILGKNVDKATQEKNKVLGQKLKKAQDRYQKLLQSNSTEIARRTSAIMMDRVQEEFDEQVEQQEAEKYAKGGKIYIKPENRGKFNATKKRTGKTTEELTHSSNPKTRKRAIFAQNARKWKHADGDILKYPLSIPDIEGMEDVSMELDMKDRTMPQGSNKFLSTATAVGELSPMLYNLGYGLFGKPEKYDYRKYINPYAGDVRSTMRNRRYNIQPELENARVGQSTFNYNLRNAGAGPSQLYGGLQAGATARQRSMAESYARQNNMNNDYLQEQARMDYMLGRDISERMQYGYDANLRNRASKRNFVGTGLSQLQQYLQMKQLMKNQMEMDKLRMKTLGDRYDKYKYNPNREDGVFDFMQ